MNSSVTFRSFSQAHRLDLVFSMGLEQPVCPSLISCHKSHRCHSDALFYDVYSRLAELHLAELGLHVDWCEVDARTVDAGESRWISSKEYFKVPLYKLPIGRKIIQK